MMIRNTLYSLLAVLAFTSAASAIDTIKTAEKNFRGDITSMSADKIVIESSAAFTVNVGDITGLRYDGEPSDLTRARGNIANGDFTAALASLKKIDSGRVSRKVVSQEIAYFQAFCATKLALAGQGSVRTAGKLMNKFIKANARSYHFYEANRLFGQLAIAAGGTQADKYLDVAAQAPWLNAKLQVAIIRGEAAQIAGEHPKALGFFDQVIAANAQDDATKALKVTARLGRAGCIAAAGQLDEALKIVDEIIIKSDRGQAELRARGYNTMGYCYAQANKPQDALLAYLHTDVLYFKNPTLHAQALSEIAKLWQQANKPSRAKATLRKLKTTYPNSPFAKNS